MTATTTPSLDSVPALLDPVAPGPDETGLAGAGPVGAGPVGPGGAAGLAAAIAHADFSGEVAPVELPVRPHLRVAPRVSRSVLRRRRLVRLAVLGVAAASTLSMFLLVAFHVFAVQASFQLDKLAGQQASEQREYERLTNEVAYLSSPSVIAAGAAQHHMVRGPLILLHAPQAAPTSPAAAPYPVAPSPATKQSLGAGP